jgi:hypothetical protein
VRAAFTSKRASDTGYADQGNGTHRAEDSGSAVAMFHVNELGAGESQGRRGRPTIS